MHVTNVDRYDPDDAPEQCARCSLPLTPGALVTHVRQGDTPNARWHRWFPMASCDIALVHEGRCDRLPDDEDVAGYVRPYHRHADDGREHAHPSGDAPHWHTVIDRP